MQELKSAYMSVNEPEYAQRCLNKPKGAQMSLNQLI